MCDERERLLDYLYDECGADERRRVEAHLETCETCRDEINGLRGTRHDLLAWDVPDHGSVWKPFVPARVTPSWRDVPRWALAAAASGIFLVGAAGGFATRVFVPAVAVAASSSLQGASSSPVDPAMTMQQIRDLVRAELDGRVAPVSSHTVQAVNAGLSSGDLMRATGSLVVSSEKRQHQELIDGIARLLRDGDRRQSLTDLKLNQLSKELSDLRALTLQQPGRQ